MDGHIDDTPAPIQNTASSTQLEENVKLWSTSSADITIQQLFTPVLDDPSNDRSLVNDFDLNRETNLASEGYGTSGNRIPQDGEKCDIDPLTRKRKAFRNPPSTYAKSDADSGIDDNFAESSRASPAATFDHEDKMSKTDDLWNSCIKLNDSKYGFAALEEKLFPNQKILNIVAQTFGRKAELTVQMCNSICSVIRGKHKTIVDVWAAAEHNGHDIVFVIIVNNEEVKLDSLIGYSFVKREKGCVSPEGKEIMYNKDFHDWWTRIPIKKRERLCKTINRHNTKLMRNHRHLTMISASPVRSKGYNSQLPTIEQEACISLYVVIKGYIPIEEEPFETDYDGIPVDVREGFFSLFTGSAKTSHDSLKSGCQIQRKPLETGEQFGTGTLGGFIDYHGYGTCGLTCAHVLLHESEIKHLAPETEDEMELGYTATGHFVYQPNYTSSQNAVGKVVKAIYREGGDGQSGIDIAVFQIEERFPNLGEFPDASNVELSYDSGKTADYSRLSSETVIKFGAETNLTKGSIVTDMATMSVRVYETYEAQNPFRITLHNLIEVRATDIQSHFAEQGDSGAFVFCQGERNELYCVGVVEGGTTQNTCIVMPIAPILEELNLTSLKCFEKNRIEHRMDEGFKRLQHATNERVTQSEQNLKDSLNQAVHILMERLSSIENNMNTRLQVLENR